MPPYWSLGFHLCRWGYRSTNATREVVQRMHNANFPLDVQWNDLDYADKRRVFTFDPQRFVDLPDMVKEFHQKGMKYILILDPGISSTSPPATYPPFDEGQRRGVFIRNSTGQTLIGKVWPGPTAFPDFTNPETQSWWEDCIREFHSRVPLDGLWIVSLQCFLFTMVADLLVSFHCVYVTVHQSHPQEPYVFGQEAQTAMCSAVMLRYSLLPFLYTLFYHAHTSADTVATPLFLQFPSDPNCQTIDRQFLWGSSLLVSPVLEQGAVELAAYLPPGTWYSLHNETETIFSVVTQIDKNPSGQPFYSKGQYLLLPAPLDTINVHVREGHIIPQQEPGLTTSASRSNPFLLTVALSAGGWAWGDLFWDDGDSLDTFQRGDYSYVIFIAGQSQVMSDPLRQNRALDGLVLGGLRVFGVPSPPRYVWANGKKVWDFSYQTDTKVLTVTSLALPMSEVFEVLWTL
ncbi:unnamed protein product [Oncorhynchus mykiss]|uniref:Glycoside hydrolase family 31 N-terminal domain-containing protein n=1 Tax=Oncorhynchus mykiss TaxID=8022 RepID=A0A060YVX8_ONCMY|nr:unnamed protein product [Oncorhynchus mykiss]